MELFKRLPISITKTYAYEYEITKTQMSDSEMVDLASDKLRDALLGFLQDKEPKRMITSGEFEDDGYRMTCDAVVCSDVAKIQSFIVE